MFCDRPEKDVLFLILLSLAIGYFEVQIEGNHGWAARLPTWKYRIGSFQLTGYHLALFAVLSLLVHFPFLLTRWTPTKEYFVLSFLIATFILEDSFWFFFQSDTISSDPWRHPRILGAPFFFFLAASLSLFFAHLSQCREWFFSLCIIMMGTFFSYPFQTLH